LDLAKPRAKLDLAGHDLLGQAARRLGVERTFAPCSGAVGFAVPLFRSFRDHVLPLAER
jgi:hypothetical protein